MSGREIIEKERAKIIASITSESDSSPNTSSVESGSKTIRIASTSDEPQSKSKKSLVLVQGENYVKQKANASDLEAAQETFLQSIIKSIKSNASVDQLEGCLEIQRPSVEISFERIAQALISSNLVPRLVSFLQDGEEVKGHSGSEGELQKIVTWIILNLAAGSSEQTQAVVNAGAIPPLIRLLTSSHHHLADMAAWALGNIAGEGGECAEKLLAAGILAPLIQLAKNEKHDVEHLTTVVRVISALSKFSHSSPQFNRSIIFDILDILCRIVRTAKDLDFIHEACWGLFYLSVNGYAEIVEALVERNVVPKLVMMLEYSNVEHRVVQPALRTLGNILSSPRTSHTDVALDADILPELKQLLTKKKYKYEATWLISNIAGGTKGQRAQLLAAEILTILINIIINEEADDASGIQSSFALCNLIDGGSLEEIHFLMNEGVVEILVDAATSLQSPPPLVPCALHSLSHILKSFEDEKDKEGVNTFLRIFLLCNGIQKLDSLLTKQENKLDSNALTHLNYISAAASTVVIPVEAETENLHKPHQRKHSKKKSLPK